MLGFAKDREMEKITCSIRLRQAEEGYEALVPQLNVSATGATIDDAVNNVLWAVSKALDTAKRAERTHKRRKKTVA